MARKKTKKKATKRKVAPKKTTRKATKKAAPKRKAAAKKKAPAKKKAVAKKTVAKKTVAKKVAVKIPARFTAASKPRTKSQIFSMISEHTGLAKKDVTNVFECLEKAISADMGTRGPKVFTVPNLMKVTVKRKPATKARKGINPFTGEEMMFKAKPARNVVKVRALKKLKDMV